MLSKNLFIHLLFKVKPVSRRAKRQHLPPPTWKLKRISMPRPMSHPAGRKESVFLPDACMSARGFQEPSGSFVALQSVTRWRPRSRRAAEGASCLGGGGRKPVPSGRCLAYEGSPASSASGGTSGDPEEIFTLVWDKTPRCLFTFVTGCCTTTKNKQNEQQQKKKHQCFDLCLDTFNNLIEIAKTFFFFFC